jgi:hypothetical protein
MRTSSALTSLPRRNRAWAPLRRAYSFRELFSSAPDVINRPDAIKPQTSRTDRFERQINRRPDDPAKPDEFNIAQNSLGLEVKR